MDLTTVTCRSTIEVKELAYAQIKNDIKALKESIRALKVRHNTLSMTMLLPPEILAAIFLWNAEIMRDDRKMRWTNVSHVCSWWRRIALETPSLWSRIIFNVNRNWVPAMLSRSGATTLEFDMSVSDPKEVQVCKAVLSQIHRIRDLCMRQPFGSLTSLSGVILGLTKPAPLLERLLIRQEDINMPSAGNKISHFNLFRGCAPRLRTLELQGIILPLNLPALSGITTLTLRNINRFKPSLNELVEALESMKDLQALTLRSAFAFDPQSDPNPSYFAADLPHLRSLNIRSDSISCTALLWRINCPHTANQRLAVSAPDRRVFPSLNIDEALCALGVVLREKYLDGLRCLSLSMRPAGYCMGLKAWGETGNRIQPPEQVPSLMVTLAHSNLDKLCALLLGLPLDHLESLHVKELPFDATLWRTTFGGIETLRMVHITGFIGPFLLALHHGCPIRDSNSPQKPGRPDKLCFQGLRILTGETCPDATLAWQNNTHRACLLERRKRGVGLSELYMLDIPTGTPTATVCEPWRTVVDKVHWELHDETTKVGSYLWSDIHSDSASLEPSEGEYDEDQYEVDWEPDYYSDYDDYDDPLSYF